MRLTPSLLRPIGSRLSSTAASSSKDKYKVLVIGAGNLLSIFRSLKDVIQDFFNWLRQVRRVSASRTKYTIASRLLGSLLLMATLPSLMLQNGITIRWVRCIDPCHDHHTETTSLPVRFFDACGLAGMVSICILQAFAWYLPRFHPQF